ncbi:MAG: RND transporter [Desulfobulbaceae bacterium]|nr:RND transporter [Desulfobulbaceae bacterium]
MEKLLADIPWAVLLIACLTIGLAPFHPPHIWEKLQMLFKGELVRPLDWFDFFLHGTPWFLLIAKALFLLKGRS